MNQDDLKWLENSVPYSKRFSDAYFSKLDGLAETKHTFLDGNNLAERFAEANNFVIAELGFGTSLNFLAAKQLWQKVAKASSKLQYISFELYPLSHEQIRSALEPWPELKNDCNALIEQFEHKSSIMKFGNIELKLIIGDANELLEKANFSADAWFLDGFSPANNFELWNQTLMQEVGTKTKDGGTFATYTSAGIVRRNLEAAGFQVKKIPGFARKREMSVGTKM